jgi:hypothetical protein
MVEQFQNDPFSDGIATSAAAITAERRGFQ